MHGTPRIPASPHASHRRSVPFLRKAAARLTPSIVPMTAAPVLQNVPKRNPSPRGTLQISRSAFWIRLDTCNRHVLRTPLLRETRFPRDPLMSRPAVDSTSYFHNVSATWSTTSGWEKCPARTCSWAASTPPNRCCFPQCRPYKTLSHNNL